MTESAHSLEERMNSMIDFIMQAKLQVESGTLVNLGDLDQSIAQICDDVESAHPDVAKQASGKMAEMISALEDLARALKAYQDEVRSGKGGEGDRGGNGS